MSRVSWGQRFPPLRLLGLAAASVVGYQGTIVFLDHRRSKLNAILNSNNNHNRQASTVAPQLPASKIDLPLPDIVRSPVSVLDYAAASAKLRREARTFTFDGSGSAKGRVDLVRVPSNDPVEDEWSLAVGQGAGGANGLLYAGVYDGHA